mmetsp:Transcript_15334/g.23515  ORF Transcript_15334/g.23515 Transcript_15334/m.23515 type:complete len:80 (-) Transcript_15334:44-283(-)
MRHERAPPKDSIRLGFAPILCIRLMVSSGICYQEFYDSDFTCSLLSRALAERERSKFISLLLYTLLACSKIENRRDLAD